MTFKRIILGGLAAFFFVSGAVKCEPFLPSASALPLCGGNQTIQQAPVDCTNSKTFTFGTLQRTVSIVLHVPASGSPSTVTWTLDKTVPQPFDIRVVAHENTSGAGGAVDSDVSGTFPANSLGPVVLTFTVGCGQIDIKAVFIGNSQSQGRVGGPYVCAASVVPTTTTATTVATTAPGSTTTPTTVPLVSTSSTQATSTSSGPGASVSAETLPATGKDSNAVPVALVLTLMGAFALFVVWLSRKRADA
jgi:LPXTG-motif cell wall-anchored protein